jgi:Icc-related predicted phosphoesterase
VATYPYEQRTINDYTYIKQVGGTRLRPDTVLAEHEKSMEFLTEVLSLEHDGPTVVVTHHAPSEMSCGNYFKADDDNAFYATNLHRFVEVMQPAAWVHGHMHSSADYMMGDTRVLANPRGYVGRPGYNQDFDPNFVFEV